MILMCIAPTCVMYIVDDDIIIDEEMQIFALKHINFSNAIDVLTYTCFFAM